MTIKVLVRGNRLKTAGGLRVAGNLRTGVTEPSAYVPAGYTLAWRDEFTTYNVEPPSTTSIGQTKWAPYWYGWNVRAISGNSDDGWKVADYEKLNTPTGTQPYTVAQLFDNDGTYVSTKAYGRYMHDVTPQETMIMRAYRTPPAVTALAYDVDPFYDYPYAGSMISTENSYVHGYGYFEIRFRLANFFIGLHLSIWMLAKSGAWPPEIDIVEILGHEPHRWYTNIHGEPVDEPLGEIAVPTYADFHTLAFERTATQLKWYLDGVLFRTSANYLSPADLPMYYLITYEIAGNWESESGRVPPAGTGAPWPAEIEIDYVRIYTRPGLVFIQDQTVIGRAVWGTDVGNTDIGGAGDTKCAFIGIAPISGSFDKLTVWFQMEPSASGYSAGHGGTIRCNLQTVDGSDNPTGTLIGGSFDYTPNLIDGNWVGTGMTQLQAEFPLMTLSSPAVLTAGQKFAIVFENVHAGKATNYIGLQALYQYAGSGTTGMSFNAPDLNSIWNHKWKQGAGAWVSRRATSPDAYYTVPIFVLADSAAGNSISQTFMADLDGRILGGTQVARQLFTPSATVTVDRARIMLARNVVGCTSFRLGITLGTDTTGTYLNSGTAFADTDISGLTVQLQTAPNDEPAEFAGRSVNVTLPGSVTLTGGTQYAMLISTTTASGIHVHGCGMGSSWWAGKHSDPCGGSGNLAQYGTVGSFSTWTNTDARLPVYLLPVSS